ncbi:endonuclease/exonuclease/phosphatase family protein [Flavobacterium sp. MAHUQ-51]|uniref:endonuclease/exonuclease/phosphatase family protein n=1 Tax=Flavobacterium sp. GCM10022190 TaxID=3252639 RepID=UPI00361F6542
MLKISLKDFSALVLFKKSILILLAFISFPSFVKSQSYRIMTYNIRYDNTGDGENQWSKRKDFLCSQIAFYNPDIFGIQEGLGHQVDYIDTFFTDYKFVGVGRDNGASKGEFSAIFYNSNKFDVLKQGTFWLSETPNKVSVGWDASMERICTYVLLIDKKTKNRFFVFNTHFDHIGNQARIKSASLIVSKINEMNVGKLPVVLMGDFNLEPQSEPIQYLSNVFNDSKSVSINKPFGPEGTFNGFNFLKPVTERIDYIFTSKKNIRVQKFAILSDSQNCRYPSDHLAVFIEATML